jgi:hypothetical protein
MIHRFAVYHSRAITYYLYHYDFFTLASEALKEASHLYHVLHIIM